MGGHLVGRARGGRGCATATLRRWKLGDLAFHGDDTDTDDSADGVGAVAIDRRAAYEHYAAAAEAGHIEAACCAGAIAFHGFPLDGVMTVTLSC